MNESQIAAYLDRGLSAPDRDRAEDHLAECAECRDTVTAASLLVKRVRRPRRIFVAAGLMLAAAAALFMIRPLPDEKPVRRGAESEADSLSVISPTGTRVETPVAFMWSSLKGATSYKLTLSEPDGSTVWSYTGSDTTAVLPESVKLNATKHYVWTADAMLEDGSRRSTGLREIQVSPQSAH